jgi:hypothetical protein
VQANATSVAQALGTDVETLLGRAALRRGPARAADPTSATAGYGASAGDALSGGVAVDRYA